MSFPFPIANKKSTNSLTSLGYHRRSSLSPLPSLSSKSIKSKKRTLVISSSTPHTALAESAIRAWCEEKGDIRSMTRVANGDIHVEYRKKNVQERVCRVRGNVMLEGISVRLDWFEGKAR